MIRKLETGGCFFYISFKHIFSCGMFNNPHLSVHPQSIQSRESKFFLTPKFCKRTRSMQALYGWISMNECLGARKSLKRTWWVEMTLKYSSQKKNKVCRFPGSPCFWNLFWNSKDYFTWVVFFKVVFLSSKVFPLSTPWFGNVGLFQPRRWWRDD